MDISDFLLTFTLPIIANNHTDYPQRQTDGSILQPIIADRNPGTDLDIDSFIRAACVQPCHPTGDGRAAHAQLSRHLFPPRTNQSRLGINPLPKILQYPPSEFKRNLRRTPPRIPCRSMWFRHTVPFLCLYWPLPNRPKTLSFRSKGPRVSPLGLIIPPTKSHKSLAKVSLIPLLGLIIPPPVALSVRL